MLALETNLKYSAELATTVWLWSFAAALMAGLASVAGGVINVFLFCVVFMVWMVWAAVAMYTVVEQTFDGFTRLRQKLAHRV